MIARAAIKSAVLKPSVKRLNTGTRCVAGEIDEPVPRSEEHLAREVKDGAKALIETARH
jgi:hypothetical protein